ncbi:MAG: ribose 5-phosphate isomerase B [Candidatus Marinimicrobia bacterium]|nr:ribose 5-phosphate isomerase B [Candidatus Neomarinimicrobiota bacterium]
MIGCKKHRNRIKILGKVFIGSDHGGVELKKNLVNYLSKSGYETIDLGSTDKQSVDYPDYAYKVAHQVKDQTEDKGVLICKTGVGMSITANKVSGVRAALCSHPDIAELARKHNNANLICFGADFITSENARKSLDKFMKTHFEAGRHARRVNKIGKK